MELKEVLERSGISYGTLRKYIDLRLIDYPHVQRQGTGTISSYSEDTVDKIQEIQQYKSHGKTLADIQKLLIESELSSTIDEKAIILIYLESQRKKLKEKLDSINGTNSLQLAERRVIVQRIESILWMKDEIQAPEQIQSKIDQIQLSEELKKKYQ